METPIEHHEIYTEKIPYTKANGTDATIDVPFFEIPKGTLLFRGVQLPNPKKDEDPRLFVRDWLGYPKGDRFCMTPTQNTFFYTSPYVPFGAHTVGEWFNAIMVYQTVKDLKVVTMISPSKWVRGGKQIKSLDGTAPIQRCDNFDYSCIDNKSSKEAKKEKELKSYDNCIHPEFAREKHVSGWMAIADYDSLDMFKEGLRGKDTTMGKYIIELESRLPGKGIDLLTSTYTDESGHRGFPEVVLFPWSPHPGAESGDANLYTEARTEEDAADAIAEMSDRFNYLPIACITERGVLEAFKGDFKAGDLPAYAASVPPGALTRKAVDRYLASYIDTLQTRGVDIEEFGTSRILFDARTGFYVMDKFLGTFKNPQMQEVPYSSLCFGLQTPEEREKVLEYKIKYRSFFQNKLYTPDTYLDGTSLANRLFAFERPDQLYQQYKELGIKFPQTFIPYIWSATETYQKNLANSKSRSDPRGADEARRKAEEAREKIQESLARIAKGKAEREAKDGKKGKKGTERTTSKKAAPPQLENVSASRTPPFAPGSPSRTPPFAPGSPSYTPPLYEEVGRLTGIQTEIPIVRTFDEAFMIGMEALGQSKFQQHSSILEGGLIPITDGAWDMNETSLRTTLKYIYEKMHHTCYFLCIKGGVPYLFKLEGGGLPSKVREILQTEMQTKGITDIDIERTRVMQCIIKPYVASTTADEWLPFLQEIQREGYNLPNGVFILNLTDALILREDQNEPFHFFTRSLVRLEKEYYNKYWLPILSYSANIRYDDIPIPNYDDIFEIKRKPDGEVDEEATLGLATFDWSKKQMRAVFRGGTTGCGYTPETNQRIKLTSSDFVSTLENADMLDVGITTITKQYKMDPVLGLGRVDPSTIDVASPLTMAQQSKYKFIIHIDGNVFAYRLLKTMLTGSCILRVKSPYKGWTDIDKGFRGFAIDGDISKTETACYIHVAEDLSNLDAVLEWCEENDALCAKIAANGRAFALKSLSKSYINRSFVNILNAVTGISAMRGGFKKQQKQQKQTRKAKGSAHVQQRYKKTRKNNGQEKLILATYRGGGVEPTMEDYIQSTMTNLWRRYLQKV